MKIKHKGKIYPSPASASLPAPPCNRDVLSVMKLLPAAILALASVLSNEDQEVLAYMITRSLDSSSLSSFNLESSKGSRRRSKKLASGGGGGAHRPPVFGCDCFDCYTSYWDRWNTSPNGELIHQAIEAFEEHLTTGEASSKRTGRGKRKEKPGRRVAAHPEPEPELKPEPARDQVGDPVPDQSYLQEEAEVVVATAAVQEQPCAVISAENEAVPVTSPGVEEAAEEEEAVGCGGTPGQGAVAAAGGSPHKGLARKVLPDVLGLLNSRLWNLWSPNV